MAEAVILSATRTPVGRYGGALAEVRPDDLAALAIEAAVARAGVAPGDIEDVYLGCANQAGEDNRNVARMAALLAGLPEEVAGVTVNRLCASGLSAVVSACHAIRSGDGDLFVAGGVESMTRAPLVMAKPERGFPRGNQTAWDTTLGWRFPNSRLEELFPLESMGETGENVAERWSVSREDQDAFALRSHQRAAKAVDSGLFDPEIVPLPVRLDWLDEDGRPQHTETSFARDEGPRRDTSVEALAKLKPVFKQGGTITAGNSSQRSDGAAAVVVMERERAERLGLRPLARFVGYAVGGVEPDVMGIGPTVAIPKALELTGLRLEDLDLVELNEAFASQSLAVIRELGMDMERVNVNGGAIALGHPMGATGTKLTIQLLAELARRQARYGMVTMCVGGGQGAAGIFESLQN
jgi:3-oxoadipyl-CoA thiolase